MQNVIQVNNLTKRFGSTTALDNVSFEVPKGVVFALLGENGAGKTTAIRTVLGLERPTAGNTSVLGMDSVKQGIEIRRSIGYVPEQPTLYEWMTVSEIGWFTAGFYPEGYLPKFYELAKEFDLPLKRQIKQLSKGMRAQVSLSLAMAHTPALLILDEPTSGLDTLVRRSFLESMVDVAADGRTVLLSSHQIPEVERVADMVAIINRGQLLVCEPLGQLKSRLEQWTISLADGANQLPELDAEIIWQQRTGRQFQLTVSQPESEALWRLREHPAIAEIEVNVPSLEEIFVTYLRKSQTSAQAAPPSATGENALGELERTDP